MIIKKLISKKIGQDVFADERIWLPVNLLTMRDFGGPNAILEYKESFKNKPVFDKNKVAITFDLHIPPRDEKTATNQHICREFAKEMGIKVFDINEGIGQHVLLEHNMVHQGDVIVGTDSHMNLLGACGALALGVGTTDIVAGMRYGKIWYRVPSSILIEIKGKLDEYVEPKDVILSILKKLGVDGALGKAIEFTGKFTETLDLAGKITLTSMVTELSGEIGFINPGYEDSAESEYDKEYKFDVSELEPLVACPHSPDNVKKVKEVKDTPVDEVFIGSCTNGKVEDMERAAKILKGKHVKVRTIIVPATYEVAKQCLHKGLYEIFFSAGAVVVNPGCALCTTGHPGILAPGERLLSTSNRNFIGKLGKGGEVWLASPSTAAATAITGKITDPRYLH